MTRRLWLISSCIVLAFTSMLITAAFEYLPRDVAWAVVLVLLAAVAVPGVPMLAEWQFRKRRARASVDRVLQWAEQKDVRELERWYRMEARQ